MRTSEEVYHRVRWDPRFDPSRFVLGVGQRDAAPKRVALAAFTPGGEIPWHRVLFVEADGELVWDRATGLDRLDTCEAGRARDPRRLRPPFFTARTPHAWDPAGAWRPATGQPSSGPAIGQPDPRPAAGQPGAGPAHGQPGSGAADGVPGFGTGGGMPGVGGGVVRVLTWNTLWDRYDSDRIDTARRRALLLRALEDADADVLALQEVEPALVSMLLGAPWVRAAYTLGTDPHGPDVDDGGLLLLSRLPVREAAAHELGPHKSVAAIVVDTAASPLVVAVTHLTSDHSTDGAGRRRAELTRIAEGLSGLDGDVVLMGDFNDGTDTPESALRLRDAWTEAHGADETPTFDPGVNPLAALSSRSGRAARLDRVLLRGRPLRSIGDGHARFAVLARQVKAWAHARGLDSAPFGGLPGLAWAVMAARTVRESGPDDDPLSLFFSTWAAWDWRDPIALDNTATTREPAPVTVLTPSDPVRNCARQVGDGGLDLLTQELYRAWELTEDGRSAELLSAPPLHRRHAAWAVVTVRARDELGRVRGRMLDLLAALAEEGAADAHAWPRPFESGQTRYAIGLGRTPPRAGRLGEIAGRWARDLAGVSVEYAEGGAVPTLI
ncbi:poly(A) polymerase [Nonomuraea endophytica]|uniref:Endonuclease/exonuclease/phosphatase family metal-dependent hydrolase/uncharacterized protein (UPF0248 family) n=1 Tax=Nonomuraea endophytica TaxID=714136 RepID=A0A7W8EHB8_9ACTN|nr:poly(A) polymerase [Nonomuraea endophytica]MBB5079388.1 endonuclease/exonuclease/phosphatase family metal-dependent hydrolase/uncharacterized protein (UPF0248 family) [Nonomuraea endophytica]